MPTKSNSKVSSRRAFSPLFLLFIALVALGVTLAFDKPGFFSKDTSKEVSTPAETAPSPLKEIDLPTPSKTSRISLEQTLQQRRSRRSFFDKSISLKQFSQLLWALQGVTADWGGRTAPSAKSAYPLEIYAAVLKVEGLEPGIYHYIPGTTKPIHKIGLIKAGDFKEQILAAAKQSPAKDAPVVFYIAANFQRMSDAFKAPADNNVYLEAGHAAQNLYLQVEALSLGTVAIGGFDHDLTATLISLPITEKLIYTMPVGYPNEL